jgi:hypothetical protein
LKMIQVSLVSSNNPMMDTKYLKIKLVKKE